MATSRKRLQNFFRNSVACSLQQTNSDIWWGYVGFEPDHCLADCKFKTIGGVRLYKVPIHFENETLDTKWWLGFEGGYSRTKTLEKLKRVADCIKNQNDEDLPDTARDGFKHL